MEAKHKCFQKASGINTEVLYFITLHKTDSSQLLSELNTILQSQEPRGKREKVKITPLLLNHRWQISQKGPWRKQKSMRQKSLQMTPACSPLPLQKSTAQMAFYWRNIWMQSLPSWFCVFIRNLAIIGSHITKLLQMLGFYLWFFCLFFLWFFPYPIFYISISSPLLLPHNVISKKDLTTLVVTLM